jgi:C-terminal processing protease CtpA/Prc
VYAIGDRLTEKKVKVAESRVKNGPGREDFAPVEPIYLEPREGKSSFTKPVIVLTNGLCYSATNYFVTAVRELDNVTTLGARTGGGGGIPAFTVLTNGWELRVSSSRLLTVDGFNVENGIEPDVPEQSTELELAGGTDTILETALDRLGSSWEKP